MPTADEPDENIEDPVFKVPFSDADRELLIGRAPQYAELLDHVAEIREDAAAGGSLGAREVLAALRSLEMAGRLIEAANAELLTAYRRMGDSAAHGYRTTAALLVGEFRITPKEARRRMNLSEMLTGRISESGEALQPVRPAIAENFADGRISADEAHALCDAVDSLPPTAAQMYADRVEKTLVELAPTVQLKDVPKLCNRIIQHVDPDGALPAFEPEPRKYNVTLSQRRNGDWSLRGLLSSPTGTTLHALLYGRMKDADLPVTVRPHRDCNADPASTDAGGAPAAGPSSAGPAAGPAAGPPSAGPAVGPAAAGGTTAAAGAETQSGARREEDAVGSARPPGSASTDREAEDRCQFSMRPAPCAPPPDDEEYSVSSAVGNDEVPKIPLEAVWESTRITVHADATVEIDGGRWTLDEDEPQFVLSESGWPVLLPERIFHAVHELLRTARQSDLGVAEKVLRAKVLGRRPTAPDDGEQEQGRESPDGSSAGRVLRGGHPPEPETAPSDSPMPEPHSPDHVHSADFGPSGSPAPAGVPAPRGVHADGSRSGVFVDLQEDVSPGIARHDRFAFLLRCVTRERVLHGADHALVITARPEDLTKPDSALSTHTGAPVTLARAEQWSNAAQTFLHLLDEGGRTVQIRSQGRFATRSQMAVLAARDQGCTFPDCDAPAEWCEAHHIVAWARGGETSVDNLTLLCPFHHRWFEKSGWDGKFLNGLPAWVPPRHMDRRQRPLYHSRFRVALLNLPPELPLTAG